MNEQFIPRPNLNSRLLLWSQQRENQKRVSLLLIGFNKTFIELNKKAVCLRIHPKAVCLRIHPFFRPAWMSLFSIKIPLSDSETGHGKLRQRTLPSQCPVRTANITQTVPNVSSHVPWMSKKYWTNYCKAQFFKIWYLNIQTWITFILQNLAPLYVAPCTGNCFLNLETPLTS